jgi:GNAT superfamily N-acetyltransferase
MSEKIEFREGTRSDRDAILALRRLTFPHDDPEKQQPDFWEWEFGDGRIFVAETADRVVGHFAFVPQHYSMPELVQGALAVDVMTHPEFQRQRVFSRLAAFAADRLKREFPIVTAFQIRDAVMPGMEAGGWRAVLPLPVLLRPLSLRSLARDFGLPAPAKRSRVLELPNEIQTLGSEDLDALMATRAIRQPRTREFIRWRYLDNPHWRYQLDGWYEHGELRAFVIHRDTILRGLRTVAIADLGFARGAERELRKLIRHVCAAGRARGRAVGAALISRYHPARGVLRTCGFLRGPHHFRLLLQVFDPKFAHAMSAPWSLSWGDTDHL